MTLRNAFEGLATEAKQLPDGHGVSIANWPAALDNAAKEVTLQLTNDLLGATDTPPSGAGIGGWVQAINETLSGVVKTNLYREGIEVNAANPVPITGTVVSTGAELRVEVPIKATDHSLLAGAYAVTSSIGDDYLLSTIRLRFSTTENKTITIYDGAGSYYRQLVDSTDKTVELDGGKRGFDSGNQITIEVTQTAGVCLMDLDMTIERGAVPLTGNPVLDPNSYGLLDSGNSTNSPLAASGPSSIFTGTPSADGFSEGFIQCFADTNCTIYVCFSIDGGVNYDSISTVRVYANQAREFPVVVGPRTMRVDIINDSGVAQTVMRMATFNGQFGANVTTFIGGKTPRFFPATAVKAFDSETAIGFGDIGGQSVIHKFGVNTVIDKATVPEDIWFAGGTYKGFPVGAPENIEFFSSDPADTGVLNYQYLASVNSTAYTEGEVTLNGTTPVRPGHNVYRMNRATYNSGDPTGFNIGNITGRHITTTDNVFIQLRAGYGHASVCGYTVPAKTTCLIKNIIVQVSKVKVAVVTGGLWHRELGESPQIIEDFSASNVLDHTSTPYGGTKLKAGDDIIVRVLTSSVDGVSVDAHLDLLIRDES